jgi:hypothetical protein
MPLGQTDTVLLPLQQPAPPSNHAAGQGGYGARFQIDLALDLQCCMTSSVW